MENAIYTNPTKIYFGKGTTDQIGDLVAPYASQVLLVYGGKSAFRNGLLTRVKDSLAKSGVSVVELGGVQPNPVLSKVREGISLARHNPVTLVLALGGGSVIDTAKAIAAAAPNNGEDVWDYYAKHKSPENVLPVATILTMPGAGSESSEGSVVTNDETMEKLALNDDRLRPVFSVLDPENTYTLPGYQTAAGVSDAISHVLERYFTNTDAVDVTDRMCEGVIRSLMKYAKRAIRYPQDYDARSEIMWACKIAHDGTLGVGREEDWASHDIEHELSAKFDVTHGAGLAVIVPAWMKYVSRHDKPRFIKFATRVFDIEYDPDNPESTVSEGIHRLLQFYESVGMPTSLRELGITESADLDEMAHRAAVHGGGSVGKFVPLEEEDIRNILQIAL